MTCRTKVLAFAGSTRTDSFNKKLVKIAAEGARAAGAEVTYVDLRDFPMPLYDEDLEIKEGIPLPAIKFKELLLSHQGLLISSPEYNSSISGVLKNAIDWASRPLPEEAPLACFVNKVAGLLSASPGVLGGLRGLVHVRAILENIKILVLPDQMVVPTANDAFNKIGSLNDRKQQAGAENIGFQLARMLIKLGQ